MGNAKTRNNKSERKVKRLGQGSRARSEKQTALAELAERERKHQNNERKRRSRLKCLEKARELVRSPDKDKGTRSLQRGALEVVEKLHDVAAKRGLRGDKLLEKVVGHPSLSLARQKAKILSSKDQAAQSAIIAGLTSAYDCVKAVRGNDQRSARAVITRAVASARLSVNRLQSAVSRLLCIKRDALAVAIKQRAAVDSKTSLWAVHGRKSRSDALSTDVKERVVDYWTTKTRVCPDAKKVLRQPGAPEIKHPTQLLEVSQTHFFLEFKKMCPSVKIGQRSFECLRPWFVRKLKDRNTCCCRYHIEMDQLVSAFRNSRRHPRNCQCMCNVCRPEGSDGCEALKNTPQTAQELVELVQCPKPDEEKFHKAACILGDCPDCGVSSLPVCPLDSVEDPEVRTVQYKQFEYYTTERKDGGDSKRIGLRVKFVAPKVLLDLIKEKLQPFLRHSFIARWEDRQFRRALKYLPEGHLIFVVDFAENYSFAEQNEIQSMHWYSEQITIFVHITYRHAQEGVDDGPASSPESPRVIKEMHFYISDDKEHDSIFVQKCLSDHWERLMEKKVSVKMHLVFSDGCASQFKCARAFAFVTRFHAQTGVPMSWSFFGSGHGKGEHDGAGAVVKNTLRREQLKVDGESLKNASDCCEFLRARISAPAASTFQSRVKKTEGLTCSFHEVKQETVDRSKPTNCETIAGTRSLHQVFSPSSTDPSILYSRKLACFCPSCYEMKWDQCVNKEWVEYWRKETLHFAEDVLETAEVEVDRSYFGHAELDHNDLPSLLQVGDKFAVIAPTDNEENADYWLCECKEEMHILKKDVTDFWGQTFCKGDSVVVGRYFTLSGKTPYKYSLCEDQACYQYSHLVIAIKFPMVAESRSMRSKWRRSAAVVYDLRKEDHELIMAALAKVDKL